MSVEHGKLYFEMCGRGPAVIFIHGGQMDRRMWNFQVEAVSAKYTMIRYDVRGYGKSSLPTGPYFHVGDLRDLMKHLKLRKATVVGLSLGGIIATDFTLTYPDVEAARDSGNGKQEVQPANTTNCRRQRSLLVEQWKMNAVRRR